MLAAQKVANRQDRGRRAGRLAGDEAQRRHERVVDAVHVVGRSTTAVEQEPQSTPEFGGAGWKPPTLAPDRPTV